MAVFNSPNHVHYFINRLRNNSILNFTVEYAKNGKFAFLDVLMNIDDGGNITTSVYCKPTDKGVYCNYFSHTAEMYKRSVIKTLIFSALKFTSNWPLFQPEIVRLKQLFCNNNYPQHLIESIIQSSVTKFLDPQQEKRFNDIKFFVQLTNLQTFNADSVSLKNIVKKHVTSLNPDKQINLLTYFKPKKLSSLFRQEGGVKILQRCVLCTNFVVPRKDVSLPILGTQRMLFLSGVDNTAIVLAAFTSIIVLTIQCSLVNMIPLLKVPTFSIDSLTSLILK